MPANFADYALAASVRDVMERLVQETIERTRPPYKYATVQSIDRTNRKANVRFAGDTVDVTVGMGAVQPAAVGQTVRVDGLYGDRWIQDVLGLAYEPSGTLGYATWTGPNNEAYGSTDTQITGLSVSVTVLASRRIKVSVRGLLLNDANAGRVIGTVHEDGVPKDRWFDATMAASGIIIAGAPIILTPTSGSHTYTARLQKNTGGGNVSINNGASCSLLVEDIGPV